MLYKQVHATGFIVEGKIPPQNKTASQFSPVIPRSATPPAGNVQRLQTIEVYAYSS